MVGSINQSRWREESFVYSIIGASKSHEKMGRKGAETPTLNTEYHRDVHDSYTDTQQNLVETDDGVSSILILPITHRSPTFPRLPPLPNGTPPDGWTSLLFVRFRLKRDAPVGPMTVNNKTRPSTSLAAAALPFHRLLGVAAIRRSCPQQLLASG